MINRSMDILERFTGKRPVGWLGPGLTQTLETPELLAEAGMKYIGDWVYDDEPTEIRTAQGPARHAALHGRAQRHPDDDRAAPRERLLLKRSIDQFDRLYAEGEDRAKIMAIAIHPTSAASRTGSNTSSRSTTTWPATMACCTGTASRSRLVPVAVPMQRTKAAE